jgi:hypothetical protein
MNLEYVQAGKEKLPFKFTKRAMIEFQEKSGFDLANLPEKLSISESVTMEAHLAAAALNAGAKLTKSDKTYTLDDVLDLDEQYDIVSTILLSKDVEEKK